MGLLDITGMDKNHWHSPKLRSHSFIQIPDSQLPPPDITGTDKSHWPWPNPRSHSSTQIPVLLSPLPATTGMAKNHSLSHRKPDTKKVSDSLATASEKWSLVHYFKKKTVKNKCK